ncbi:MAG: NUDIX domain-containing protein [Flavobacteriaceae bacterium]|nr:NUDIX domain-containing protein [Flavobacteriaceae bacterium]
MVMKDSTDISSWISDNHDVIDLSELKFLRSYSGIFAQSKCGSFLMQRRDNKSGIENPGMLSVFGGDSEGEETCIETAIREFFEETGIRLKHSDMTHIIDIPMPLDNRDCKLCSYYLVRGLDETDINLKEGAGVEKWSKKILLENTELTEYPRKILEADLI